MEVPKSEEIKEQLNQIFTKFSKNQNIINFEIYLDLEANYGDGFVGQFYKGKVRNKDTDEVVSVAIKKAPTGGFDYNDTFKNQVLFYETSYPVLDNFQKEAGVSDPFDNVAKYFCGSLESKGEYLVMENLKLLGYVMHDKTQYLDAEHLERLFKIYGKFHAISYILRKKDLGKFQNITKNYTDIISQLPKYIDKPLIAAVSASINSLNPVTDKPIYDALKDLGENVIENYLKACTYNGEHRALIHGDCWSNNMLFKYSDSGKLLDIKLLDFQLCKDDTPIHDLSYFFYSGASKKDLDKLDDYLEIYYKTFVEFAKELGANSSKILSFQELRNEWKENALFGVMLGIYLWPVKLVSKEDLTKVFSGTDDPEIPKSVEQSWNEFEMLQIKTHGSHKFKERTTAILRHAFNYGVINKNKIIPKAQ